jgi:hypothetical protein
VSTDGIIYKVKDGEWVGSIAEKLRRYDWKGIWDHPDNSDLRELRGSPWTIGEGDELFIPPPKTKWVSVETGRKHTFVLKKKYETFRYRLEDLDQDPICDETYTLEVFQGNKRIDFKQQNEKTDKDGLIVELVPGTVTKGTLSFPRINYDVKLNFGFLSPLHSNTELEKIKGVQQRLEALGYDPGPVDGIEGSLTKAAVARFQEFCEENHPKGDAICVDSGPVDGVIGSKTIEAIIKRFGA